MVIQQKLSLIFFRCTILFMYHHILKIDIVLGMLGIGASNFISNIFSKCYTYRCNDNNDENYYLE